ncbi:MAG: DUF1343 domain-containing protein [Bacteroidetes bacterium]|nr:DUF1343 domain-containing protein [Bacteroidota bacterium]
MQIKKFLRLLNELKNRPLYLFFIVTVFSCSGKNIEENHNYTISTDPLPAAYQTHIYFPMLEGKRIAFAGNHTSFIDDIHLVDTLLKANINIVKIFSPEHGFRGLAAAGEYVDSEVDVKTGLPIISLYGNNRKPKPEHLNDVDIILFDIQDVGARFYTYISTMTYIMEAAAKLDIPVIILDRPNPNGHFVDGPILEKEFSSFVGLHPVPIVHGMTIGEYANMVNYMGWLENGVQCSLTVINAVNYTHNSFYEPPIFPSPNLPNILSIYLYPSLCFFEGTQISVGRGTEFPFQIYGHSKLPNNKYSYTFKPESITSAPNPPQLDKVCYGINLTTLKIFDIRDDAKINLDYLIDAYNNFPEKDKFFNNFFNRLAGNNKLQEQIKQGMSADDIRATWKDELDAFKLIRKKFLLYPDFE